MFLIWKKNKKTLLVNRKWWGAVRLLVLASVILNREHLTILTFCLLTSSCSSSLPKCTVATAGGDHPYFCLPVLLIKKMSIFVNHISFWSLVLCALSVCAVCRVVLWCAVLTAHRSFDSSLKPFCMFFLCLWCSCFLPQSKVMHIRLIENS